MRALLFDLYGVLMSLQSEADLAAIERAAGQGGDEFWSAYWHHRQSFDEGLAPGAYWGAVAAQTGTPIADPAATIAADFKSWSYCVPETLEWVLGLVERGVRVGVLSNIPEPLAAEIEVSQPWLRQLQPVLLSGRIGVAKPDRKAYEVAIEAFGLAAKDILFIDDREANIRSALACGLAAHEFSSLADLIPVAQAHLEL